MLNKCLLIGRLGKDPEVRYTPDGTMVTTFSVATDESWKGKDGQKVEKTEWHNITAFGKLAEICAKYLVTGQLIYVEGKIQTDSWEKEGIKRYATKIIAGQMKMLGGKQDGDRRGSSDQGAYPDDGIPDDVPF